MVLRGRALVNDSPPPRERIPRGVEVDLKFGRVGLGDDIAVQILAFMGNGFATGSIVYIDGGALIN